jgi:hypothetical protein
MSLGRIVIPRDGGGPPVELWSELPVVQELPHVLWPDEIVRAVFTGSIAHRVRPNSRKWLIVLTDQRVLCLKQRRTSNAPKVIDVSYDSLTHVTTRARVISATVILTTAVGTLRLRVSRADAHRIAQSISTVRRGQTPIYITPAQPSAHQLSEQQRSSQHRVERLESNVDQLEAELARMQRQVEFLEQLLHTRMPAEEITSSSRQSLPPGAPPP